MALLDGDDVTYIRECLGDIAGDVEEPITYRMYIGTTPGDPVMGMPDKPEYNDFVVSAVVRELTVEEIQVSGGVYAMGDVEFTIRHQEWMQWDLNVTGGYDPDQSTIQPEYPDRIVYDGSTFKPKIYQKLWLGGLLWWKVRAGKL